MNSPSDLSPRVDMRLGGARNTNRALVPGCPVLTPTFERNLKSDTWDHDFHIQRNQRV